MSNLTSTSGQHQVGQQTAAVFKNAALIYNPFAGRNPPRRARHVQEAADVLRRSGMKITITSTSGQGHGKELAREAVEAGHDLIVVCGGDGTVNEVINGIAPGTVPLAVLPGGTANVIAKELRIPGSVLRAARALTRWRSVRIPLGLASWQKSGVEKKRYFVCLAGLGFDASIIPRVRLDSKLKWGVLSYGYEAVRQAIRYHYPVFECHSGSESQRATFAVLQRSRRYAGWLRLAPGPGIGESSFACCAFGGRTRERYLLYGLAILARVHHLLPDVIVRENCDHVCTRTEPGVEVGFELDGEWAGHLPAEFEIVPDALTVLAPSL